MKDIAEVSRLLRALAVEMRLRILHLIADRQLCVGALAELLGITQGAVSQHLRVLRDAGLVRATRRGMFIHYEVDAAAFQRCQEVLVGLLRPPSAPRCGAGAHRGASSCPRRNGPAGKRKR